MKTTPVIGSCILKMSFFCTVLILTEQKLVDSEMASRKPHSLIYLKMPSLRMSVVKVSGRSGRGPTRSPVGSRLTLSGPVYGKKNLKIPSMNKVPFFNLPNYKILLGKEILVSGLEY